MRIDSAALVPQSLIRSTPASMAPAVDGEGDFADMIGAQPPAEQSRAYSFLELGWAGHAGANSPAAPSDLLAQSSSARSRSMNAGRQTDQDPNAAPELTNQPSAALGGAVTRSALQGEDRVTTVAGTQLKTTSIQPSSALASPLASPSGAQAAFTLNHAGSFADVADVPTEILSEGVDRADPVVVNDRAASRVQTPSSVATSEIDNFSDPPPPDAPGDQLARSPATQTDSGGDISVVVSQQGGTTQVFAGAPELAPVAAARLRKAVEGVAAEFGVTISEISVNGASLGETPISLIGVWNGRHAG